MCHVCKNREKNMLAFVLWLNIACNMLVSGEENEHCLHNFICWPVATHGHSTSPNKQSWTGRIYSSCSWQGRAGLVFN